MYLIWGSIWGSCERTVKNLEVDGGIGVWGNSSQYLRASSSLDFVRAVEILMISSVARFMLAQYSQLKYVGLLVLRPVGEIWS